MVHPTSKLLRNCVFTCVWMRSILGQMMVYGFLAVHCTGLRFKYDGRHKIRFNGLARYSLTAIVVLANLLVGIIITIVPKPMTITFFDGLDVCMFQDTFKNAVMVLSWATLGITIGVCVYLNFSVKCRHHEGTDLLVACFALAMASAFQTAVFYVKPRYPVNLGWRVAVVSLDQISLFVTWWAVVGRALYNCMVRKEAYLIDWSDKDPPT
ncbi:hypothetical protein FBU31_002102 [Coemansia sp. 'formosensis']|nr:hypothetical protein FBU31_002102 [Coemansia sp. 'formosensis']